MKTIRKDVVLENESMDSLQLEMQILNTAKHQFLIGMDYVFNDEFRVYFIMDYIDGGELFRHLLKVRRFQNDQAQFMIAQIALAIGYLHSKKILYRDLKPENVLFRRDGYVLLADYGLAKQLDEEK